MGARPLRKMRKPNGEQNTQLRTGECMSSLDLRAFSVPSRRLPILRPILTLSVVFALSVVALAAFF